MQSFGFDTAPQSFVALSMIRCSKSAQKFAVRVCQVATVVMETTQLVLSQFKTVYRIDWELNKVCPAKKQLVNRELMKLSHSNRSGPVFLDTVYIGSLYMLYINTNKAVDMRSWQQSLLSKTVVDYCWLLLTGDMLVMFKSQLWPATVSRVATTMRRPAGLVDGAVPNSCSTQPSCKKTRTVAAQQVHSSDEPEHTTSKYIKYFTNTY